MRPKQDHHFELGAERSEYVSNWEESYQVLAAAVPKAKVFGGAEGGATIMCNEKIAESKQHMEKPISWRRAREASDPGILWICVWRIRRKTKFQ